MKIERTDRGFAVAKFIDEQGMNCSIQDSSIASESCCWFGVSRMPGAKRDDATRMHLTVEMMRRVGRAMCAALEKRPFADFMFEDRYGSTCKVEQPRSGNTLIVVGVHSTFGSDPGRPMQLGRGQVEGLMPLVLGFLAEGTIAGEGGASELEEPAARVLDVKIPVSMIGRTDIGETGVSAQDLVNAFMILHDYYGDDVVDAMGHDMGARLNRLAETIDPLKSGRRKNG